MVRIEVYADITCPFTHVGLHRLHDGSHTRHMPLSLRVRAWPLEWINGAPLGPDLLAREVDALRAQVAPDLFARFDPTLFPFTSIPAFGLAAAAYAVDDTTGANVSLAIRDALFEDGQDVSDPDVLHAIGHRFDVQLVDAVTAESATRVDWERGRARAVQGSPHFFIGSRNWFCPSLEITHDNERFDIHIADKTMRDFYAAAFEEPATTPTE